MYRAAKVEGRWSRVESPARELLDFPPFTRLIMLQLTARRVASQLTRSTPLRLLSTSTPRYNSSGESDLTHPALLKDPPVDNPSTATDPWTLKPPPLPPVPEGPSTMKELLASPHPEGRDGEPTETLRKRLVYESRKRGILEMDLILGTFAKTRLETMDEAQLREYDRVSPFALFGSLVLVAHPLRHTVPHPPRLVHLLLRHGKGARTRAVEEQLGLGRAARSCREQGEDS